MESFDAKRIGAPWDHEPESRKCLQINETTGRFMESEVSFLERIAAMNLVALSSFAPPRSVTAEYSDAPPWEVARWKDWFRLATCALIGEPRGFPLGRFVLFGSQPGTVGRT